MKTNSWAIFEASLNQEGRLATLGEEGMVQNI